MPSNSIFALDRFSFIKKCLLINTLVFLMMAISTDGVAQKQVFYLTGDAGEWKTKKGATGDVLERMKLDIATDPSKNKTVLFLGDNIYPKGYAPNKFPTNKLHRFANQVIDNQLEVLEGFDGHVFFIPGNHDWARGKIGGKKRLKYQSDVLNKKIENESGILNKDEGIFQPLDGLPGPYVYDIGNTRLVIIDTHWFLHGNARGKYEGMNLKDTKAKFWNDLDHIMSDKSFNGNMIVAAHHPLQSVGEHGKRRKWWTYPVHGFLGQIFCTVLTLRTITPYMLFSQDIQHPKYQKMKDRLIQSFDLFKGESLIYVAGHEHNLQYWNNPANKRHFIVSGSGSKASGYDMSYREYYEIGEDKLVYPGTQNDPGLGYFKITIDENDQVTIEIYRNTSGTNNVILYSD